MIKFVREYKIGNVDGLFYDVVHTSGRRYFYTEYDLSKTAKDFMKKTTPYKQIDKLFKREETIWSR